LAQVGPPTRPKQYKMGEDTGSFIAHTSSEEDLLCTDRPVKDTRIIIKDDHLFDKNHFVLPKHYYDSLSHVLLTRGTVNDRIEKMAMEIRQYYGSERLELVCVLKGSRGFFSRLVSVLNKIHRYSTYGKYTDSPFQEHYVRIKSYHNTESTGQIKVMSDDLSVLKGKNVLIVEDIIDSGNTLIQFCDYLDQFSPKSVKVTSLVEKRTPLNKWVSKGDFIGFSVPNEFIVGYCLDYNEKFRDLDHICIMNESGIQKYAE